MANEEWEEWEEFRSTPCPQGVGDAVRKRILHLLENKGVTVNKFCTLTGIPQGTVSHNLRGKSTASILTIKWICDALGITLAEFFDSQEFRKDESNKDGKDYWVYG